MILMTEDKILGEKFSDLDSHFAGVLLCSSLDSHQQLIIEKMLSRSICLKTHNYVVEICCQQKAWWSWAFWLCVYLCGGSKDKVYVVAGIVVIINILTIMIIMHVIFKS